MTRDEELHAINLAVREGKCHRVTWQEVEEFNQRLNEKLCRKPRRTIMRGTLASSQKWREQRLQALNLA